MCMMDYCDDMVTMLSESDPKARKPHRCNECRRVIAVGEKYHVDRYVFDGSMTAHKTCAHCMVAREWLAKECGGWVFGSVEEDLDEHLDSHGFGLMRIARGMDVQWCRKDGRMWGIPRLPMTTHDKFAAPKATK
jgi:hypothetical protein